jgi:hypothetical protein
MDYRRICKRIPVWIALMLSLLTGKVCVTAAGADEADLAMEVRIFGALFRGHAPGQDEASLILDVRRAAGHWNRVWGIAGNYVNVCHPGRVDGGAVSEDRLELVVTMNILGDSWTPPSGRANYRLSLDRTSPDSFAGTYQGWFRGIEYAGRAEARILARGAEATAVTPSAMGERPRLLFRKQDLPRLRERLNTAFGEVALARMTDAIGLGVKYQLLGDGKFADQARRAVEAHMADAGSGDKIERGRPWGQRLEQVSLAYDLCYEAWPAEFRREVEEYLVRTARRIFYDHASFHKEINWTLGGPWAGPIKYGAAMGGLALLGEKGQLPPPPVAPTVGVTVAPATGYSPGQDVPVVKLTGQPLTADWIYASGFKPSPGADPLEHLGGVAQARPVPGAEGRLGGYRNEFRRLAKDDPKTFHAGHINLAHAIGRVFHSTAYFYAVIDNDRPRWVTVSFGEDRAKTAVGWLNGTRVAAGDCVQLERGLYPFMIEAAVEQTSAWGAIMMEPRLTELSDDEAAGVIAARRAAHEQERKDWEFDRAESERLGGADPRYVKLFELGRFLMQICVQEGVGEGGYKSSSYSAMNMEGPHRYAAAYRTMFGRDLTPAKDVELYLPRMMFQHVYLPDGTRRWQDIDGPPGLTVEEYIEKRDASGGLFQGLFPLTPLKWKPAVLWAWNHHLGIAGREHAQRALERGNAAWGFVNYPLEMTPEHPAASMPLTWQAPDAGYYGFRSGWASADDFLVQSMVKRGARQNAGSFRVMGLGEQWAQGPGFRLNTFRWMENVVLFPEDEINTRASGRLTHLESGPDGSGALTIDMNDVYAGAQQTERGRRAALYERYGNIRRASAFKPTGITGLRAIGVDYSGQSGAPCLLVIVDRINGGGRKVWAWQLGGLQQYGGEGARLRPGAVARGDLDATTVDGNTFTITKGDANLRATFITPVGSLAAEQRMLEGDVWFKKDKQAGQGIGMHCNAVFAEGNDNYFVVITIQRGDPPPVSARGEGLNAIVTVGRQTVRFDGEKIIFGQ